MTAFALSARLSPATVAALSMALPAFAQNQTQRTTQPARAEAQVWRT